MASIAQVGSGNQEGIKRDQGVRCCISQWHCQPSKCRLALPIKKFCQVKLPKIANCLDYALFKDTNQREEQSRKGERRQLLPGPLSLPVALCMCVWVCVCCAHCVAKGFHTLNIIKGLSRSYAFSFSLLCPGNVACVYCGSEFGFCLDTSNLSPSFLSTLLPCHWV